MTRPPVLVFAWLAIVEAGRRRLFWALVAMTLASVALTAWGVGQLLAIAGSSVVTAAQVAVGISQVLILVAFMFSFVLAMTAAFLAAPAIAGELESGIILTMAARPIRRADLLVGRWLGLSAVVAAYAILSGLLEIGAVAAVSGYTPPDPLASVLFLGAEAIALLTLTLLLSTRLSAIAGGAIAIVAFGLAWMLGVLGGVGAFFGVEAIGRVSDIARLVLPTDLLWRGVVFALEPPAVLQLAAGGPARAFQANPFFAALPPAPLDALWALGWIVLCLGLAVLSFRGREL